MLLQELSLPEIDIFDAQFAADPHGTFRRARESGAWLAKYQFGYLPLDFETVRFFFRADDLCRPPNRDITAAWNAQNTTFSRFFDHMLLALRGEEHRRLRRIVAPAFTARQANKHRRRMRELLRETMAVWLPSGRCDFSQAISPYPIGLICELIGVPRSDVPRFAGWLEKLESAYAQDARALPELNRIIGEIFGYIDGVLDGRRRASDKPQDLLQALLEATDEGGLSDEELRCLLTVLLGAGFDTTKNQITSVVYLMTRHPEHWVRAAHEKEFVKPLIEEALRYMSPIGAMHRVTNVEIEYRGVTIPANTFMSLSQNVPGRDPAVNEDPDRFDPNRKRPVHIAFGQGEHSCLGHFIARALLEEAVPILAHAVLEPRLAGDPTFRSPMGTWGLASLPITFTAGKIPGEGDEP
jgi:cytochrome P450